jgi:parallel beta-helix repeat protein
VTDNEYGIWLEGTSSNRISDNSIAGNLEGIRLYASSSNSILENDMMHNCYGIRFYASSSSNSVVGNSIADSCVYGIFFDFGASVEPSGNNCINHNNFENNTRQVYDVAWEHPEYLPSINIWDNGCEGNYWSNNNGTDSDGDGVGDTPYIIDAVNQDNYPLMNCFWNLADINHDLKVDLKDVFATGKAYGSYPGHPRWNPHCDVNADGKVDLKDYYAVCKSFGKSW